jgi:phage shock protein PspC (stress-responsive transcriptional regulator)
MNDEDRYCRRCGFEVGGTPRVLPMPRLMLDKRNKKIAGVCAGFARYWTMDPTLVRVLWLVIALCTGIGFLAYLGCWIVLPSDEYAYPEARVAT